VLRKFIFFSADSFVNPNSPASGFFWIQNLPARGTGLRWQERPRIATRSLPYMQAWGRGRSQPGTDLDLRPPASQARASACEKHFRLLRRAVLTDNARHLG
jgi:hypothetical protein